MYGIPNMKLEKHIIDRKVNMMKEEGIEFITGVNVGKDVKAAKLQKEYDRIILACGAKNPRDINAFILRWIFFPPPQKAFWILS